VGYAGIRDKCARVVDCRLLGDGWWVVVVVAQLGTILSFDEMKGYGFIMPEGGGDDVFVHANDFGDQRRLVRPGLRVEFEPTVSDRGLKAGFARLIDPEASPQAAAGRPALVGSNDEEFNILTVAAFRAEITDLLIEHVQSLTGEQIAQIRRHMLVSARSHGWIED
jgi:CspA family cold shock protein